MTAAARWFSSFFAWLFRAPSPALFRHYDRELKRMERRMDECEREREHERLQFQAQIDALREEVVLLKTIIAEMRSRTAAGCADSNAVT